MSCQCMYIADAGKEIATEAGAGYHTTMKRSTLKLVIRRETLRLLSGMELRLAGGGVDSGNAGTGCPLVQLVDSGNAGTGCPLVNVKA
jgi:hypothetical protein